jgi:GntR family transcriptional regulator/MocR family aminotransferase
MEPILPSPRWAILRQRLATPAESEAATPLFRRLYLLLRHEILDGHLAEDQALPPSRALAQALGVGRNTVLTACELLHAEGFLTSRQGSAVRVAGGLTLLTPTPAGRAKQADAPPTPSAQPRRLSTLAEGFRQADRPRRLPIPAGPSLPQPFRPGLPALDRFPWDLWARGLGRRWRRPSLGLTSQTDIAGYRPLRQAIADYLRESRAVTCDADQVLVVNGAQQALDLAVRLLVDRGEAVMVEDPGFGGVDGVLRAAGARPLPVAVDGQGACLPPPSEAAACRVALLTPSRSYPLGLTMSLPRRLEWLSWLRDTASRQGGGWIIEDDYDSDFRFDGPPLASLQGLDDRGQVLYGGTFTRALFPSVRLGYLVVPPDLIDPARRVRQMMDGGGSVVVQAAAADFMAEGHFAAHVRAMRRLYSGRRQALSDWLSTNVGDLMEIVPADGGLHLTTLLPKNWDDQALANHLYKHGLEVVPLSPFFRSCENKHGLILGYAAWDEDCLIKSCHLMRDLLFRTLADSPYGPLASG